MTTPRHPKIPKFLEMGLFNDLQSFGELESRIEGLEPEKEKGDAFEVFALAYISSSIGNKLLQATDVWPRAHRLVRGGGGHWGKPPRILPQMARILSVSGANG